MSTTAQATDEPQVSPTPGDAIGFTDWDPTKNDEPTEAEEQAARETTLSIGNATTVGPFENGHQPDKYDRLDKHNRDNFWEYREDVSVSQSGDIQFKRKALLAFAHQLSLSPLQRQVALDRFLELDLPRCGHRTEIVVFCTCAVVLNEDAEKYFGEEKPYYPTRNPENNHSSFAMLQAKLIERWGAITESRILSVYQKVRQGELANIERWTISPIGYRRIRGSTTTIALP